MSRILRLYTGDQRPIKVQLTKDRDTFAIDATSTVKAALIRAGALLSEVVNCAPDHDDADWDNSLVAVEFEEADTHELSPDCNASLEIEVDDPVAGTVTTWRAHPIEIVRGLIP